MHSWEQICKTFIFRFNWHSFDKREWDLLGFELKTFRNDLLVIQQKYELKVKQDYQPKFWKLVSTYCSGCQIRRHSPTPSDCCPPRPVWSARFLTSTDSRFINQPGRFGFPRSIHIDDGLGADVGSTYSPSQHDSWPQGSSISGLPVAWITGSATDPSRKILVNF